MELTGFVLEDITTVADFFAELPNKDPHRFLVPYSADPPLEEHIRTSSEYARSMEALHPVVFGLHCFVTLGTLWNDEWPKARAAAFVMQQYVARGAWEWPRGTFMHSFRKCVDYLLDIEPEELRAEWVESTTPDLDRLEIMTALSTINSKIWSYIRWATTPRVSMWPEREYEEQRRKEALRLRMLSANLRY